MLVCLFFRKIVAEFFLSAFSKTYFRNRTVYSQLHTLYSLSIKRLPVIKGISEDVCAHWLQESWNDSKILFVSERLFEKPYSWSRWQALFLSALLSPLCIPLVFFTTRKAYRIGFYSVSEWLIYSYVMFLWVGRQELHLHLIFSVVRK